MSKPEVAAYMWEHRGRHACVDRAYAEQLMDDGEQVAPLIRLTDYERLQAETEMLQADRAADKARIAALSEALRVCLEVEERPRVVAMARKALAQQCKDGET